MDVQMPDGTVIQGVPEGTTKEQLQQKLALHQTLQANTPTATGTARELAGMVTGPLSGLAGIAGAPFGHGADWQAAVASVPGQMGEAPPPNAPNFMGGLSRLANAAGGRVAEATGSPALGAGVNTLIQAAPMALTPARGPEPLPASLAADAPQAAKTWAAGQEAGYKLPAGQALEPGGQPVGGPFRRLAEYVGGKATNEKETSLLNQVATQKAAASEAGVPAGVNLNVDTLNSAKGAAKIPYQNLGALDVPVKLNDPAYLSDLAKLTPETSGPLSLTTEPKVLDLQKSLTPQTPEQATSSIDAALAKVNELRDDAARNFRTATAESVRLAKAQRAASDSLDNLVGRTVQKAADEAMGHVQTYQTILKEADLAPEQIIQIHAAGQDALAKANKLAGMMTDYKAARVLLSKIHVIEDAMNPGSGLVSAAKVKAAREAGAKLTGGLQTIADMNAAFPKATQPVEAFGSGTNMDLYDILSLEHGMSGALKGKPESLWQLGVPTIRRWARRQARVGATPAIQPISPLPAAVGAQAETADQLRRIAGQ